jgi:hypothetical protein
MLNGTVQMSLADVDKLRQEVKEANEAQKKAENELVEVKADKRIVKVTKSGKAGAIDYDIDTHRIVKVIDRYRDYSNEYHRHYGIDSMESLIKQCISVKTTSSRNEKEKIEFVNFDDVKQEIRKELDEQYSEEIGVLRAFKKDTDRKIAELKQAQIDEIATVQKEHEEELDNYDVRYEALQKEYRELETGRKELSKVEALQETIKDLRDQLDKERNKRWYRRIF